MVYELSPGDVLDWNGSVREKKDDQLFIDVAWNTNLKLPLLDTRTLQRADRHTFSHTVKPKMHARDQGNSGRCWAFAGLTILRRHFVRNVGMKNGKNFQFSQSYFMFCDKLEKAHTFLRRVQALTKRLGDSSISAEEEERTDRYMKHIMGDPVSDAGTWGMFVNIVQKYGVLPQKCMHESDASSSSSKLNFMLKKMLLQFAGDICDPRTTYSIKSMMKRVHRVLCIGIGIPPTTCTITIDTNVAAGDDKEEIALTDDEKQDDKAPVEDDEDEIEKSDASRVQNDTILKEEMNPQRCFELCDVDFEEYATIVHCPSVSKQVGQQYAVRYLSNVYEDEEDDEKRHVSSHDVFHSVDEDAMPQCVMRTILKNEGVWFACEMSEMRWQKRGVMHAQLLNYERLLGEYKDDKQFRIDARAVDVNHAMVLTGFHQTEDSDGRARISRWQVENSHGKKPASGYLTMDHSWFQKYVFVAVVRITDATREYIPSLDAEDVEILEPWDVLGSVAQYRVHRDEVDDEEDR